MPPKICGLYCLRSYMTPHNYIFRNFVNSWPGLKTKSTKKMSMIFIIWGEYTQSTKQTTSQKLPSNEVLLGDMGTGKTSLVLQYVRGQFFDRQEATIGAAYFTKTVSFDEASIKFDIWDTAGQERYHSLAPMYYRNATAALLVYDISNMDSFVRAKKLVQELQRQDSRIPVMSLVGNKVDLEAEREVTTEEAENLSEENGLFFIETSAKTSHNINELFHEIAKRVAGVCPVQQPSVMNLRDETQSRRRLSCCSR
ncbi:ras-related protein Rab5 isoform X2 [Beta vulgaris subsp. vulgaris]|uniref:ras-related protein Rab5 isoform X2 n=1 Tax=Beta vulgaris subsp. vulgaris TaxID=3555 RepID=UPI00053FE7E2|nr:ras-related protein Rab5 isoform X2 [Beta vulgaris subsp. vulgaris]